MCEKKKDFLNNWSPSTFPLTFRME